MCSRAESLNEDQDDADVQPLASTDIRTLVNEITSIRAKQLLHLVPVDILVRLLNVLDRQIRLAEGLTIDDNENVSDFLLEIPVNNFYCLNILFVH